MGESWYSQNMCNLKKRNGVLDGDDIRSRDVSMSVLLWCTVQYSVLVHKVEHELPRVVTGCRQQVRKICLVSWCLTLCLIHQRTKEIRFLPELTRMNKIDMRSKNNCPVWCGPPMVGCGVVVRWIPLETKCWFKLVEYFCQRHVFKNNFFEEFFLQDFFTRFLRLGLS